MSIKIEDTGERFYAAGQKVFQPAIGTDPADRAVRRSIHETLKQIYQRNILQSKAEDAGISAYVKDDNTAIQNLMQ